MSYNQNGYPQPPVDNGRRPVIINAHPNNGQNFPRRNQTLSRPERQPTLRRTLMRMENRPPPAARAGATSGRTLGRPNVNMLPPDEEEEYTGCWVTTSHILTFWAIGPVFSCFGVSKNKDIRQAWREKISLCIIIFFCWCIMGFFTVGIQPTFCNTSSDISIDYTSSQINSYIRYMGNTYRYTDVNEAIKKVTNYDLPKEFKGMDITPMFRPCKKSSTKSNCDNNFDNPCALFYGSSSKEVKCELETKSGEKYDHGCLNENIMKNIANKMESRVAYDWADIESKIKTPQKLTVYNGLVIDLTDVDTTQSEFTTVKDVIKRSFKKDATRYFRTTTDAQDAIQCFIYLHTVGNVDKTSPGCFLTSIIMYFTTIAIFGVVLTRFTMAIIFSWFVSSKIAEPKSHGMGIDNKDIYTICLVTAYSEGEEGIRTTLNSLASTTYPDKMELLFVIADGIIMGSGNDRSTPDICIGMIIEDPKLGKAEPKSYFAIADGRKQHNMARVHAGVYIVDGHKVPAVVVVKCGTPEEAKGPKPGNRGKRDSQLILMNFLSRVTFDDRMTPLDYDLFRKIQHITGVTPDKFEIVLMVDADTKVLPTSLSYMTTAMKNDPMIMGLCGETRIANKTTSWVTWIQVFEYYISHHLGKCFESLFGGVTCLPGCFCMYRIKAPKPGAPNTYVPVLANPDIVEDYSENIVDTLHKKNLLLLGEDRFLTTLMLRTFPKRKMIFVPQALCKTIVPDEFKVLLSQRRRWINSTIHNLMELVLVRDLCGTFCFSMQFVVAMELFGTVVLPAAIIFTAYLIVVLFMVIYESHGDIDYIWEKGPVLPIIMLFAILGLPGILIMLTSQKVIYVLWMFVYLAGLPVWNFILPVYAFWHFDDFSWGETRKVQGDTGDDHSKKEGKFDASEIPLKRWHEYEKENRIRQGASPYLNSPSPFMNPQVQRMPSNRSNIMPPQHMPSNRGGAPQPQRMPSNRQGPPPQRAGSQQQMQQISPQRNGSAAGGRPPYVPMAPNPAAQRMGSPNAGQGPRPPFIPQKNNPNFR